MGQMWQDEGGSFEEEEYMKVTVHLYTHARPIQLDGVRNTYQKGDLFCVRLADNSVHKFPLQHIFRVVESTESD